MAALENAAATTTVAVDLMGGDRGPEEVVKGAQQAAAEGVSVLLVGDPELVGDTGGLELVPAHQVVDMHDDPALAVRQKRDSSLVRAMEAVRDGRAGAVVSAGNTGAAMASAILKLGRVRGIVRPAIATLIPVPGSTPTVLLDAGANPDPQPEWLVQFAQMGSVLSRQRLGIEKPRVGLLSNGEEETKGTALVKAAHALLAEGSAGDSVNFVGNVEGSDIMSARVDVVVTDGFTGNVALKCMEGVLRVAFREVLAAFDANDETRAALNVMLPALAPLAATLDADTYGGAVLLGVKGVCVISHGSSSAKAIYNAVKVAHAAVRGGLVGQLQEAIDSGSR
ncbi:MAG: phosphate acyltransferase PlsX [Acidimicrobiales bacterium]